MRVLGTTYYLHRLVWLYVYGEHPPEILDHIDRNPLNNRISNLRLASYRQNAWNKGVYAQNSTGLKGVQKSKKRFVAVVNRVRIGLFDTPEEAHEAYKEAAKVQHGEFYFVDKDVK